MDPEIKELLKEDVRLAKETNEALKELLWQQKLTRWMGIIKWVIVIASALGLLYYLQPVIDNLWGIYSDLLNTLGGMSVKSLPIQEASTTAL